MKSDQKSLALRIFGYLLGVEGTLLLMVKKYLISSSSGEAGADLASDIGLSKSNSLSPGVEGSVAMETMLRLEIEAGVLRTFSSFSL